MRYIEAALRRRGRGR